MFRNFLENEDGLAAVEATFIFPILMMLLLGTFDLGNGLLANQKAIRASQVIADLIARDRVVDDNAISEAIEAGRLAFSPLSSASFGYDVVSVRFDENATASVLWRETSGMGANADVLSDVSALALPNEGVLVVAVNYTFEPLFAGFVVDQVQMQEVAFARGRKSTTVTKE